MKHFTFRPAVECLERRDNPSFATPVDYSMGDGAAGVAVGDLDADGNLDVVVCSQNTNEIVVRKGNGDGTFGEATAYSTFDSPQFVLLVYLDSDGYLDAVVCCRGNFSGSNGKISVLVNNTAGGFGSATDYATEDAFWASGADIDGDLDNDLAIATNANKRVLIFFNDGYGAFGEPTVYLCRGGNDYARAVVLADIDGSNGPDLIYSDISYPYDGVRIRVNNGSGIFNDNEYYLFMPLPYGLSVGDVDGDNDLDIVTTGYDPGAEDNTSVFVYKRLNNGTGTFGSSSSYNTSRDYPSLPYMMILADIDGDDDLDAAITFFGADLFLTMSNNGSGVFSSAAEYSTGDEPYYLAAGDFDEDGLVDIIIALFADDEIQWFENT